MIARSNDCLPFDLFSSSNSKVEWFEIPLKTNKQVFLYAKVVSPSGKTLLALSFRDLFSLCPTDFQTYYIN
jgi:hypothetical protein